MSVTFAGLTGRKLYAQLIKFRNCCWYHNLSLRNFQRGRCWKKNIHLTQARNEKVVMNVAEALLSPEDYKDKARHKESKLLISKGNDISCISGIPEVHRGERTVRIYEPVKNSMQSGTNNLGGWQAEFDNRERWENANIGYTSTGDPMSNVKLQFRTKEQAVEFCDRNGWNWFVQTNSTKPPRTKSYVLNYAWDKRSRTSTK